LDELGEHAFVEPRGSRLERIGERLYERGENGSGGRFRGGGVRIGRKLREARYMTAQVIARRSVMVEKVLGQFFGSVFQRLTLLNRRAIIPQDARARKAAPGRGCLK
jgi:hypothetical protein